MTVWRRCDPKPANWPQWLKDADIEWCKVDIVDGDVIWHDGVWHGGDWREGRWYNGVWYEGIWHNGVWHDGIWYGGDWLRGEWYDGEWRGGCWCSGNWYDGDWVGGEWQGGDWHGGEWHRGFWLSGIWKGGDSIARLITQALVGWSEHGECGRVLRAWDCPDRKTAMYSCGCFSGSREKLVKLIYAGEERYRASRLQALACVDAMLKDGRETMSKESSIFNDMIEKFNALSNKEEDQ